MKETCLDGTTLRYADTRSEGETVLLIHGFPMNHRIWEHQLEVLRQTYRCIAPDLRGFGESGLGDEKLTLDRLAADVAGILDKEGIPAAHIIGVSLGGMVAMRFAAAFPDLTLSLVVMHSEAISEDPKSLLHRREQISLVKTRGVEIFVKEFARRLFPDKTHPDIVEKLSSIMVQASQDSLVAGLELLRDRPDLTPLLPTIPAPALIVAGELDIGSSPAIMMEMEAHFSNVRFEMIEQAGHMSIMDQPEASTALLKDWLDGLTF